MLGVQENPRREATGGRSRTRNRDGQLELEHRGQLNAAGSTAADERVTDAHIAGRGDYARRARCVAYFPSVDVLEAVDSRVRKEGRQERVGKVWVIDDVEEIGAQLHGHALSQVSSLVDCKVPLFERRAAQGVAPHVAEVPRASYAILSCSSRSKTHRNRARNCK